MYTESDSQIEQRVKAFTYHPPFASQPQRYQHVRSIAQSLACLLNNICPPSRELSIAQTKLEEAVMWANAAIARNERSEQPNTSNAPG